MANIPQYDPRVQLVRSYYWLLIDNEKHEIKASSKWKRDLQIDETIHASGVLDFLLDRTALWVGGLRKVGIDLQRRHIGLHDAFSGLASVTFRAKTPSF